MDNYTVGINYLHSGEIDLGKKFLQKAVEDDPESAQAWAGLGECYFAMGEYSQAREALEKSLQLNPEQPMAMVEISVVFRELGEKELAVKYFMEAGEKGLTTDEEYRIIGTLYHKQNKLNQAEESIQRSLDLNPKNADSYNILGMISNRLGNYDDAIKYFRRAIELAPERAAFKFNLANIYRTHLKEYKKAAELYEQSLNIDPNKFTTWNNLGITYMAMKNYDNAERCLKKCIQIAPAHFRAYYNLACLFSLQNHIDKALKYVEEALELAPHKVCKRIPDDPDMRNLWEDSRFSHLFIKYCGEE